MRLEKNICFPVLLIVGHVCYTLERALEWSCSFKTRNYIHFHSILFFDSWELKALLRKQIWHSVFYWTMPFNEAKQVVLWRKDGLSDPLWRLLVQGCAQGSAGAAFWGWGQPLRASPAEPPRQPRARLREDGQRCHTAHLTAPRSPRASSVTHVRDKEQPQKLLCNTTAHEQARGAWAVFCPDTEHLSPSPSPTEPAQRNAAVPKQPPGPQSGERPRTLITPHRHRRSRTRAQPWPLGAAASTHPRLQPEPLPHLPAPPPRLGPAAALTAAREDGELWQEQRGPAEPAQAAPPPPRRHLGAPGGAGQTRGAGPRGGAEGSGGPTVGKALRAWMLRAQYTTHSGDRPQK